MTTPADSQPQTIYISNGPWWSSGLERQSHDILVMLKVEGSNPGGGSSIFFRELSSQTYMTDRPCTDKNELLICNLFLFREANSPQFSE